MIFIGDCQLPIADLKTEIPNNKLAIGNKTEETTDVS